MKPSFISIWLLSCLSFCIANSARAQGIITAIAGNGITQYIGEGAPATSYSLARPVAVCADKKGKVYLANYATSTIMTIYNDTLKTVVGDTSGSGDTGDGHMADSALLRNPDGLCMDTAGNLYIAEFYNDLIRRVDAHTGIITTICGISGGGYGGDGYPATLALLNSPHGICTDIPGNIYVADYNNQRIRKVNIATGEITTIAGTGANGYAGDLSPATNASLSYPNNVCTDTLGNVYFTETGNSTVRKIDVSTGIINTLAGTGTPGYSSDGTLAYDAQLSAPNAVFADKYGYVYISDYGNDIIRTITPDGLIYTIAGNGMNGYSPYSGPPLGVSFRGPTSVCTDDSSYIYVADGMSSVVWKMSPIVQLNVGVKNIVKPEFDIYPNPSTGKFTVAPGQQSYGTISVFNTLGQNISSTPLNGRPVTIDLTGYPQGLYFAKYSTVSGETIRKVIIH